MLYIIILFYLSFSITLLIRHELGQPTNPQTGYSSTAALWLYQKSCHTSRVCIITSTSSLHTDKYELVIFVDALHLCTTYYSVPQREVNSKHRPTNIFSEKLFRELRTNSLAKKSLTEGIQPTAFGELFTIGPTMNCRNCRSI